MGGCDGRATVWCAHRYAVRRLRSNEVVRWIVRTTKYSLLLYHYFLFRTTVLLPYELEEENHFPFGSPRWPCGFGFRRRVQPRLTVFID